jgi:hypothetical protein
VKSGKAFGLYRSGESYHSGYLCEGVMRHFSTFQGDPHWVAFFLQLTFFIESFSAF